jgi:hypothetical protein
MAQTSAEDFKTNRRASGRLLTVGQQLRETPAAARAKAAPPMPFIVGSPRSGTTMLRLMLDAHPALAIPPETGFVAFIAESGTDAWPTWKRFWKTVTQYPDRPSATWPDFHLAKADFRAALEALKPFDPAEGLRAFYRLYAARFDKRRVGDETPSYARHLTAIESPLPEARFIHLVRDGRDAAVSLRNLWFSPGATMTEQAAFWRDNVLAAREQGARVRHYREVRYEALVTEPERVLRDVCAFIEPPYSADMQSYYLHAPRRLDEHEARLDANGTVTLSKESRRQQQTRSTRPPMPALIGRWHTELSTAEAAEFELVAGDTLALFGYSVG